jgi:aldose 1-epimerase
MTGKTLPPSGEQHELRHAGLTAVVVEVGGALRELSHDGRPLLDGYGVDETCVGARGQTLVPWPNRIRDGRYSWQGADKQLALSEPEQHNAIHGLARWQPWAVAEKSEDRIALRTVVFPQTGWDWPLEVVNTYTLSTSGLTVRTEATNLGAGPCPYAVGAHPYITAGTDLIDACSLTVPAALWLPTGEQQIPTGQEPVDGTAYDFRQPRTLGDTKIDYAFTDLLRDPDGKARVRLVAPDGHGVAVWVGEAYPYVEIFTGDALPDAARRRRGLGVEPMTGAPDAFNSRAGLVTLEPAATHVGEWGVEVVT